MICSINWCHRVQVSSGNPFTPYGKSNILFKTNILLKISLANISLIAVRLFTCAKEDIRAESRGNLDK